MKLLKIIDLNKKYVAKNGKEYTRVNYYIVLDNGSYIAVKPVFSEGYTKLDTICEVVRNGSNE